MTGSEHINEYFNGRAFMVLSAVMLVVTAALALSMGCPPPSVGENGAFFSFGGSLFEPSTLSASVNVLCLLATGGIMLALNKVFTYVRSMTHLFVSAFFLLQMANPQGLVALNPGTLLCLVAAIATLPLFASFQDGHAQRSIFLIFALAAAGSMFHYGFLVLMPAFFLGFLNMGVLNLKGLLAILFGLVTPFWIVLGLGIATPADFVAPAISGVWQLAGGVWPNVVLIVAAVTALLGIVLAVMNLPTIMNYRMQTRVYNAFFVITLAMAVIAMCLDCRDVAVFLPLLGLMVSVQVAQAHTLRASRRYRYVFLLLFIAACIASAAANLMIPS